MLTHFRINYLTNLTYLPNFLHFVDFSKVAATSPMAAAAPAAAAAEQIAAEPHPQIGLRTLKGFCLIREFFLKGFRVLFLIWRIFLVRIYRYFLPKKFC